MNFSSTDWFQVLINADAVTCSLALHHLTDEGKAILFRAIGKRLAPAGSFILADMFVPATESAARLWGKEWDDVVRSQSLDTFGDDRAFLEFQRLDWNHYLDPNPDEYDRPSSIIEHIDWLKAAGLADIDIHYFRAGHGIVSATKKMRSADARDRARTGPRMIFGNVMNEVMTSVPNPGHARSLSIVAPRKTVACPRQRRGYPTYDPI